MNVMAFKVVYLITLILTAGLFAPNSIAGGGLIDLLTGSLGVTKPQAEGGAGAIFGLAKSRLAANEFQQLEQAVPGLDTLLAAAPKSDTPGGSLGGVSSLLGGASGTSMAGLASLAGSFSQLGMNADMISKFVPVILDYVQKTGGEKVMGLLKNALQ
jgi:hypothetical protein